MLRSLLANYSHGEYTLLSCMVGCYFHHCYITYIVNSLCHFVEIFFSYSRSKQGSVAGAGFLEGAILRAKRARKI